MSPKLTVVLIFLFIGVGTLAVFDPFGWQTQKELSEMSAGLVHAYADDAAIESIEISPPQSSENKSPFRLVAGSTPKTWTLVHESDNASAAGKAGTPANQVQVDGFLRALKNLYAVEQISLEGGEPSSHFATYGIPTSGKVKVQLAGGARPIEYLFGSPAALGGGASVYLWTSAQPQTLFLVGSGFLENLQQPPQAWIKK